MLWPWSRVSVWPLSVSSKLTERSVATGDQRKQWPRVITRHSWIIPASILAEIWPKRVSNLMFYAQSTITVISGWWPKLRKRNKKHIHIKKPYSQDHKGTHIKSNASCCSFQFHIVPFVRKGHLHCQHSGPKWTSLLMFCSHVKLNTGYHFIFSVWENANI